MKHKIKRRLSLACASVLAMLALTSRAYAINYTCDGGLNPVPAIVIGTVNINLVGENCDIDHDVTATGSIFITTSGATGSGAITTKKLTANKGELHLIAPNNAISTKELKSGWHVKIEAKSIAVDGSITGQTAQLDTNKFPAEPSFHANMLIRSQTDVTINGNVSLDGGLGAASVKMGGIQIDANLAGGNSEFVVGGSGASGVTGYISTQNTIGGGNANNFIQGGVRISNGTTFSTGGIRVIDLSNFKVKSSGSRAGNILLDAQSGTLTLPAGMLDARGTALYGGGIIQLNAKTIEADDDTIVTTSQDADGDPTFHKITIAAETVKFKGQGGLKVIADGDGLSGSEQITIGPWQSNFFSSSNNVNSLLWTNRDGGFLTTLSFEGEGTAPLVVRADGNEDNIGVYGYPVKFEGGDVSIRTRGATNHNIQIGYQGDPTGNILGLSIDITGDFLVDTNGEDGNGGKIIVKADQSTIKATNVYINASGPPSNDGDGGTISWKTNSFALDSTTKFSFIANAASADSGNAVNDDSSAILFDPGTGELALGTEEGQINFSARGGSTSGNAGKVTLKDVPSAITVYGAVANATVIDVSVPGTTGNGGVINITTADALNFASDDSVMSANAGSLAGTGGKISIDATSLNVAGSNAHLVANGRDTGKGGEITVKTAGDFAVANGNGTVSLEARNVDAADNNLNGNADGGIINLTSGGALDLYGAAIGVSGGQKGGTLKFKGVNVILSGDFTADGGVQGDGGSISIEGNSFTLPADVNTIIGANGNGSGSGGSVSVTTHGQAITISGDNQAISLQAKSNESGDGGSLTINSDSDVNLNGAALDVSAGTNGGGLGGKITITTDGDITATGDMNANGGCSNGDGGSITLDGPTVSTLGTMNANAGDNSCMAIAARNLTRLQPRSATAGTGIGGKHKIVGNEWVVSPLTKLNANGSGDGQGGFVEVQNNTTLVSLRNLQEGLISAKGGDSGMGGKVSILKTLASFDVNKVIKVEAGSQVTTEHSDDGVIILNGQECHQWTGLNGSWPSSYWVCTADTNPDPGSPQYDVAKTLHQNTRDKLGDKNTQLYLFSGSTRYNNFNKSTQSELAGGVTFDADGNFKYIYSTAWLTGGKGNAEGTSPFTYSSNEFKEVAAHELGHAIDIANGLWSREADFGKYFARDIFDLNYVLDTATSTYVKREPCTLTGTNTETPPFTGVYSLLQAKNVCNGTVAQSPFDVYLDVNTSSFVEYMNDGRLAVGDLPWSLREEIHAQFFGYVAGGPYGALAMTDSILDKTNLPYFTCMRKWADNIKNGVAATANPPTTRSGACNVAPPVVP